MVVYKVSGMILHFLTSIKNHIQQEKWAYLWSSRAYNNENEVPRGYILNIPYNPIVSLHAYLIWSFHKKTFDDHRPLHICSFEVVSGSMHNITMNPTFYLSI